MEESDSVTRGEERGWGVRVEAQAQALRTEAEWSRAEGRRVGGPVSPTPGAQRHWEREPDSTGHPGLGPLFWNSSFQTKERRPRWGQKIYNVL